MTSQDNTVHQGEKKSLRESCALEIEENFDWDWIFEREWSRTKK
jgi:hypothetical protein